MINKTQTQTELKTRIMKLICNADNKNQTFIMNNPTENVVYESRRKAIHHLYDLFLFDNNILIKDIKMVEYILSVIC